MDRRRLAVHNEESFGGQVLRSVGGGRVWCALHILAMSHK
ncbi:MAG: hypothetical protein ACI9K2_006204, partial [Myxococcota bacterium]